MDQLLALLAVLAVFGIGSGPRSPDPPVASTAPLAAPGAPAGDAGPVGDAAPARRGRRCGSTPGDDGMRYDVSVGEGPVSCRSARRVFRSLFGGEGAARPAARPGDAFTQVGPWRCFYGMGSWECQKQTGARQRVAAVPKQRTLRRCAAGLRPTGVRVLRVRATACENAARLIATWSAADKRGSVTRVGGFSCRAQGPAAAEATGVRCRGRSDELVLAAFGESG